MRYTATEAVTRRRLQRQAAEDDKWRVGEKSKWTRYHARRGCGEQVYKESFEAPLNATDGGRR